MHLNKKFFAPLLSLAAFFSAASARAQDLPDAPKPQQPTQTFSALTPAQLAAIDSTIHPPKLNLNPYDKQWTVLAPADTSSTFTLSGKLGKAADFAEHHSADGVPGFDLAAQAKVSSHFTIVAGTPEFSTRGSNMFSNSTQTWRPEINLYNDSNTRVTMKPKRGGVAVGIRIQFH